MRVLVVDDHPVMREGLSTVLQDRGLDVVGEACSGEEALARTAELQPDVVLLDLAMPGMGGVEACRRLRADHPAVAVLVVTMSEDEESLLAALRAGARGYLLKEAPADEVARAVASVAAGGLVVGARVSATVVAAATGGGPSRRAFPQLSDREHEVLELVARGYDNGRVARHLGVSEKTVRNTVSNVLGKLPAATRAEAVARARDHGLGA